MVGKPSQRGGHGGVGAPSSTMNVDKYRGIVVMGTVDLGRLVRAGSIPDRFVRVVGHRRHRRCRDDVDTSTGAVRDPRRRRRCRHWHDEGHHREENGHHSQTTSSQKSEDEGDDGDDQSRYSQRSHQNGGDEGEGIV